MKGFIEVKDKNNGTVLINITHIYTVKPRVGLNGVNSEILMTDGRNDDKTVKYSVVETYVEVKALIEDALKESNRK